MVPIRISCSDLGIPYLPSDLDRDTVPAAGALDRREHHRQALDVVSAARLGLPAGPDGIDEFLDDTEMAADPVARVERGHLDRLGQVEQPVPLARGLLGHEPVKTVPGQRAALANDAPARLPFGLQARGAPA